MAGHDASINTRVSLLTESLLSYFMGSRSKTVKSPTRNAAIYVPQVRGSITSQSDDRSSIGSSTLQSPKRKPSLLPQDKAAATCLVQNLSVLSQRNDAPQWMPDETPDWALTGEDSPRCSFDSHISFEIETPRDYIHLSDLMATREVDRKLRT